MPSRTREDYMMKHMGIKPRRRRQPFEGAGPLLRGSNSPSQDQAVPAPLPRRPLQGAPVDFSDILRDYGGLESVRRRPPSSASGRWSRGGGGAAADASDSEGESQKRFIESVTSMGSPLFSPQLCTAVVQGQ